MSLPALASASPGQTGLAKSAVLMRALGAKAAAVWSQLSPEDASRLSQEMELLPEDAAAERGVLRDYVKAMQGPAQRQPSAAPLIWDQLSRRNGEDLVRMIENESPQVIAVILSQLTADAAASVVRRLPRTLATEALKRLLNLGDIHPRALSALEVALSAKTVPGATRAQQSGHARLAEIFDQMDGQTEQSLLSALDGAEPGAGEKIRALMFTFDDLARLDPASLQTILVNVDRVILTMALKGASDGVSGAFFQNITQRAGDLLREDIAALGPVRRSDIEAARAEVLTIARTLVKRGDILSGEPDDELIA